VTLIAPSLRDADAEARLFGREEREGTRVTGILEEAGNGTLFIHELEDLPPGVQRLLVGVFEAGQFTRIGGAEPVSLRARLLSAAQPGVEHRAGTESLRRDLLAQLNVLIMRVPPLREYAEDVPELLRHHVDRLVDADGLPFRRFSVAAQNRLRNYPWPDNVRELRHLVHRMLIHGGTEEIRLEEIERELAVQTPPDEPLVKQDLLALPLREAREQFERAYLQQQLLLCNGKVGQLAKRVGMERTHLYRKLRSLGVDFRNISED
jgi:DNA-binding NtrC family response regulator